MPSGNKENNMLFNLLAEEAEQQRALDEAEDISTAELEEEEETVQ